MLFLFIFSLLFWAVTGTRLLPLNMLFVSDTNDGFTFMQDLTAADFLVLQVSYHEVIPAATKPLYLCEALSVRKQRKNDHILIESVPYKVLHRDEHLLLTSVDGSLIKLRASNTSRHCIDAMVPISTILAPHHSDVVVPVGHKDQLAAWSKVGFNVTYFSAHTGAVTAHATVVPSPLAIAACPSCTMLSGYKDEQYWFATPGLSAYAHSRLVNQQGEAFVTNSAPRSSVVATMSVSKTYFLVRGYDDFDVVGFDLLSVYKKSDHSLYVHLRLPRTPLLQCDGAFLSPDETRVLAYCSFYHKSLLYGKYVYQWLLVEISLDTGALVDAHSLPSTHVDDPNIDSGGYYGGISFGNDAILARVGSDTVHIYKYSANTA